MNKPLSVVGLDILFTYDTLLVDMYGVVKGGDGLIPGVEKTLQALVEAGKRVIFLSNTTQKSSSAMASYQRRGLLRGVHYHDFITSGQVAFEFLSSGQLCFDHLPKPKKYSVFGTPRKELFEESGMMKVSHEEADFFYISIPQLTEGQRAAMPVEQQASLYLSTLSEVTTYDTLTIEPFLPELQRLRELGLPALLANPDHRALEKDGATGNANYVIRQGAIASAYQEMGGEVVSIGKPHTNVYQYCLDFIESKYSVDRKTEKFAMIGDTLGTDILGATTASETFGVSIESVLTLTGVSAAASVEEQVTLPLPESCLPALQRHCENEGIFPTYIISSFGDCEV